MKEPLRLAPEPRTSSLRFVLGAFFEIGTGAGSLELRFVFLRLFAARFAGFAGFAALGVRFALLLERFAGLLPAGADLFCDAARAASMRFVAAICAALRFFFVLDFAAMCAALQRASAVSIPQQGGSPPRGT
jgi:hypothetical protein